MQLVKLGSACLNQTPMQWDSNQSNILAAIDAARELDVRILCLPELCISGYGCEDAFLGMGVLAQAQRVLLELLPATRNMIVAVGLPLSFQNRVYNCVALLVDGDIAGFVAKRFLAGDGIHYEPRWFHTWPAGVREQLELNGKLYPIGDIKFNVGGVQIGFEICEEAWVAKRPGIELAQHGVDVILNPSASHFSFQKFALRQRFVLEGSRAFSATYVYANLLGNEAGRIIYDGGGLIASDGQLLALGKRFGFNDWELVSATVDLDLTRMKQTRTSPFISRSQFCVNLPFDYPMTQYQEPLTEYEQSSWENSPYLKEEEFTRAEALGLFDYLRKSHTNGFVVSLSGGADSGAIACLVRMMVELAVADLGFEIFCQRLGFAHLASEKTVDIDTIMKQLLACMYQSTANSSRKTRKAASTLARALSAEYFEISVESQVNSYVKKIASLLGRELNWQDDDLALQNIQARSRSPGIWLLANIRNALLLATSNRSEAAVGYATMDGDTSGSLSPLTGIDKHFLRNWLVWLEQQGPVNVFAIPELKLINEQQPTAELRPDDAGQTDEVDLMPYDLLNAVERAAILDRQTPWEIFCRLQLSFPAYEDTQLLQWIERFFQLWTRNQWKRERYAPSFHLDDENLDPRSWCRFPILCGNFNHELHDMWQRSGKQR